MTTDLARVDTLDLTRRQHQVLSLEVAAIAKSALVPASLRNKPDDLMLIALKGQELGLPGITYALENIHVINGTCCLSAKACVALAMMAGHDIWTVEWGPERSVVSGSRKGKPDRVTTLTWTLDMAKRAGLIRGNDSNWIKFPQNMLYARASKEAVKQVCPDILMGIDNGRHMDEFDVSPNAFDPTPLTLQPFQLSDGIDEAEVVDPSWGEERGEVPGPSWADDWRTQIRSAGLSPTDSKAIIRQVSGNKVELAHILEPELREAAEQLLADLIAERNDQ